MTTIKCACGNPMCVIKIVVEDDQHIMLTGKDGEESLMYFYDETREALSHALNFSRAEAAEDRIAQLEADCANLKMIMSAGDAHMAALTAERDEARRQLEQAVAAEREACAKICESNAIDNMAMYNNVKSVASFPESDLGVLKYLANAGQAQRDALSIRERANDPH